MIYIGKINKLTVFRETESGFYLKCEEDDSEVFLPPALNTLDFQLDDQIEVFVYHDDKGGVVATTQMPLGVVDEYALLNAVEVTDFGAFFDWGIDKDLLVPGNEQKIRVQVDQDYIVRICLEERTDRVFGTTKLGKFIEQSEFDINEGDVVNIIVANETDLGFRVIVDKKFIGMIYHNEIFKDVFVGDHYKAVVKKIREDKLVDLSLQSLGINNLLDAKEFILKILIDEKGELNLTDKSLPEAIKAKLGMSKKTFKAAIGMLYKERKILISKDKISLVNKEY